ncbi:hypothetical protein AGLY_005145, partial [Aphis glycines]
MIVTIDRYPSKNLELLLSDITRFKYSSIISILLRHLTFNHLKEIEPNQFHLYSLREKYPTYCICSHYILNILRCATDFNRSLETFLNVKLVKSKPNNVLTFIFKPLEKFDIQVKYHNNFYSHDSVCSLLYLVINTRFIISILNCDYVHQLMRTILPPFLLSRQSRAVGGLGGISPGRMDEKNKLSFEGTKLFWTLESG